MTKITKIVREAYREALALCQDNEMRRVMTGGLTILYGPPMDKPDLFLVSFQGGGAAPKVYETWPERLLYLDDEWKPGNKYKFGRNLCRYAREADLYRELEESSFVVPAVFPGEHYSSAQKWMAKSGPRAVWREFSVRWVERFIDACDPKVVIVFGNNASKALGLDSEWAQIERNHASNFVTFATAQYRGVPAVYSGHLSQGYVGSEVVKSLRYARQIVRERRDA